MSMRWQTRTRTAVAQPPFFAPLRGALLQRKCACGGCAKCCEDRLIMQCRAANQSEPSTVPSVVHEALRSPGQPLDAQTRAFMEPRFGHDFSRVQIHADSRAAQAAESVNAFAYTVGRDVVFGAGQYAPNTPAGRRLLAHELAHVVQQDSTSVSASSSLDVNAPADRFEQEADRVADSLMALDTKGPPTSVNTGGPGCLSLKPLSLQRSAKFVDGSVSEEFNLAERVISGQLHAGNTDFVLNGTPLGPGANLATARKALNTGGIGSAPTQGGRECWFSSEPVNEVTYEMKVLKSGTWTQVTTADKVAAQIPTLRACAQAGNSHSTFVIKANEDLRKRVRSHEDRHAADYKTIFNEVLVPWDDKVTEAFKNKSKMKGKDEDTCQNNLYRFFIKNQPDDIATRIINDINAKAQDFHKTAEGRNVKVSVKDVAQACSTVKAEAE